MKLGIDMIEIDRIQKAVEGPGFLERVYTEEERSYCEGKKKNRFHSYAGLYSAKEAFLKALGTGMRYGSWQEIEIHHDDLGAPFMVVKGTFKDLMEEQGLGEIVMSITHCQTLAMSQVILQKK